MSLDLRRRADLSEDQLAALEKHLSAFYKNPPASYYRIANQAALRYTPQEQPLHCDLASRVFPGATLLEVGCGTAHLCHYVEKNSGIYTGLDFSEILLQENRQRFPDARFFPIGTPLAETFDIVASLYTLEHVVDPPAYLESLWRYCHPGGLIAIICPEFVDGSGLPPSVFFGTTPRRLREKIQRLHLLDAWKHLLDWKVWAPLARKRAQASSSGSFWINLKPGILNGVKEFSSDTDAVHCVRLKDLVWFFEQKGGKIIQTSTAMPGVSDQILQHNCYVLAQKLR